MIGVQGTQTPAGDSGKAETPQELALRRLSVAPRKAECLERKSTAPFIGGNYLLSLPELIDRLFIFRQLQSFFNILKGIGFSVHEHSALVYPSSKY
ncbi:hypothetical protein FZD51_21560 [Bacillus infantis]|uniref:Uncharacterized protein n=1 Tax=Bacillus infantis TaxID=324767 RepID=A0A5D4R2A1_9BACI|nr:hypothetical protein FZD51_21560 [Bacillus infantis]